LTALRVGFDVTALLAGETGVARYVRVLGAATSRHDVELLPYAIGRGKDRTHLPPGTRAVPVPLRLVHRSWALSGPPSAERIIPGADVIHVPDLVPPPTRRPLVMTLHDLAAVEHPDVHPTRAVVAQGRQLRAARDHAAVVVCDSQATADAASARGVDAARITVVPLGVTALPAPGASPAPADPYLLAVGSLTPRKGLDTLVAAFARAAIPRNVRLVLAGPDGWSAAGVRAAVEQHGAGRVSCRGRGSDAELAALYDGCLAVCAASLAEGFGLPILEAGAAGAPVVASDIPVFRELAGAVALFAAAGDEVAWTAALERIVADGELRRESAAKGGATAAEFTWDRTASMTVAAYERAVQAA
jgi:glycosyltransferase involved in cell wall biosynthesis